MKSIIFLITFSISFVCFGQNKPKKTAERNDSIYALIHSYDGKIPRGDKRDFYRSPLVVMNPGIVSGSDKITTIEEQQVKYIRNVYLTQGSTVFYDTIAIDKLTSKPLNGFYKIKVKNRKYDTVFESFKNGSPFLVDTRNPSAYYKSNSLVKQRFYIIEKGKDAREAMKGYAEDYIPIASNKWRREIKTWPSEQLIVEDTVYYRKGKGYIEGVQNIYDNKNGNKNGGIGKTHFFEKGKLTKVVVYQYDHNRTKTISSDLTDKNFATVVEDKDDKGNVYKKSNFVYFPPKKCQFTLLDSYYTEIEKGEQCFVPDGSQYEYKGSAERNQPMDIEETLYYDKGILIKIEKKSVNPNYTLSDDITIANYGKPILVRSKETIDYKAKKEIRAYFSGSDAKPIVNTTKTYFTCISHPLFESYKCNEQNHSGPAQFKSRTEYYDPSGKLIFESDYDDTFKGSFEEDIHLKVSKK
ncbi:hypothetical protein CEY12_07475 [Chryseobacterium sp. T16E-39]|uniref:hypothetical protein n=1 Tax=Chryseobacterium sp. T16E-39 TaxID=2015076 RepID=UPI000B5B3922|nr:hypothetical protein [Chryseobacterium sp. T16E-39]ASK29956.1 hypothetical protein CEY12_07475 [Chryseobacterium sp. T16E-39]